MPRGIRICDGITNARLLFLYREQNMTLEEMAHELGYSSNSGVYLLLKSRGLSIRSNSESHKLSYKKNPEPWFRNRPKGVSHHRWNNGKRNNSGYTMIKAPEHPRADSLGYVREHIVIWEKAHNKKLPMNWIIHHLNGLRSDNRPENLVAMPRQNHEHNTYIKSLQARIRQLEQLHFNF